KCAKIVDCIGSASRYHLSVAVIQHQDGRLARNTRDFAVNEDVCHEITKDDNALAMESVDDGTQFLHANLPERIDSTASSRFSAMKCGCSVRCLCFSISSRP